ncbi:enoyl-CoA hydratase/isomerase family protein [Pseudaquabacterium terrae]|uniref:enoyl-CoA hydratase/isomerase family protein n=1 Tax=Pseudaquabacterium terrae TaxID=2732868 RepID=UPI0031B6342D
MNTLEFTVADGVATLTFNRPAQRNAIDLVMRGELAQCFANVQKDRTIRALVLTGAGGAFCAGGDLRSMQSSGNDGAGWRARMQDAHQWVGALIELDRPVIAAVDGPAYGAGFSLVLAADFVIATPAARFCMPFLKLGLVPDFGALHTLPRVVGMQRAKELMLSAREVAADEALRLGIVGEIVPADRLPARAQALAASFTGASPLAISLMKRALAAEPANLAATLEFEADAQALCFTSAQHREAVARFLDKQPAAFVWPTGEQS